MTRPDLEQPLERIAALVEEMENLPDPATRERARSLVQAILDVHRLALRRLLDVVAARGGVPLIDLAKDDAIALILSLHGLHPQDLDQRVSAAVEDLRGRLRDQGVDIELTGVADDRVEVALRAVGPVQGSSASFRAIIDSAIARAAPEIAAVDIKGLEDSDVPAGRLSRK